MRSKSWARKFQVLFSVLRNQSFPSEFADVWAGVRHIFGLKIIYALPSSKRFGDQARWYSPEKGEVGIFGEQCAKEKELKGLSLRSYSQSPEYQEAPLLICFDDAYVTRQYPCHDSNGNPFLGSALVRGDLSNASGYPCGYPFKIRISSFQNCSSIDQAFFVKYLFFNHFGHALTELVSSIYPLIYWSLKDSVELQNPILIPFQFRCYREKLAHLLKIDPSRVLVPGVDFECLHVRRLVAAEPSFVLSKFISPFHHQAVKSFLRLEYGDCLGSTLGLETSGKIYISRSRLGYRQRQFVEEKDLERCLESLGWLIFHPQEHPLEKQLMVYENASFICGLEGSAMHLLLGVSGKLLEKVILLCIDANNDFALQFSSQDIAYSQMPCLVKDDYWPFGKNRNNVRLRKGLSVSRLAAEIELNLV